MTTIAQMNDDFRHSGEGGVMVMTRGVHALPRMDITAALNYVTAYNVFDQDNDPHGEHDFGSFDVRGRKFFWKIDYYNPEMTAGSEDPSDPNQTARVLTVMLASEY